MRQQLVGLTAAALISTISLSAQALGTPAETLRCEYQTGYGEGAFYLGYDFNLQTRNFENLVTLSVGPLAEVDDQQFAFIEATGRGHLEFGADHSYAKLNLTNLSNPVPFVLKCRELSAEPTIVENFALEILSEDPIDGEIKPNIEFMNYCGNDTAKISLDLSKYMPAGSTWFGTKFSLFGRRDQFGPSVDCGPGVRLRENFKVLNQLLNEARANGNRLDATLRIRKQKFAPSGYAVKLELKSERLKSQFVFFDNLGAQYDQ